MQPPFHAIDINLDKINSNGIAYFRMDDQFMAFIQKCQEENRIIGFAWEGTRNFGIILADKNKKVEKAAGPVKAKAPKKK